MSASSSAARGIAKAQSAQLSKPTAMERLERLEKQQQVITLQTRAEFQRQGDTISNVNSILQALIELVGTEEVATKMRETRVAELEAAGAAAAKALDEQILAGTLREAEVVTSPKDVVVTQQRLEDGTLLYPSKLHYTLEQYDEDVRDKLVGCSVGDKITTESSGVASTIEVLAIYMSVAVVPPPGSVAE